MSPSPIPGLTAPAPATANLSVRPTTEQEHAAFVTRASRQPTDGAVSFLQCPSWARVKLGWRAEFLGWFDGAEQVGAALVLCRRVPGMRKFFAYVPEGPVLDWARPDLDAQLATLLETLRGLGAFAVRIGPPLESRRWQAATLKGAVGAGRRVGDVNPDDASELGSTVADRLRDHGWQRCADDAAADDAQPRYVYELPLAGRTEDELWSGLNQGWRRNVRRAAREQVAVALGGRDDMTTFHRLLEQTEERDGFRLGRSLAYFQRQYDKLNDEAPGRMKLYLARHDGEVLAAHTMVSLGLRAWYLTGGSANHRRDVRPSHALQWRMIQEAHANGAATYDMRGIPETLDPDDREFGLMQWKLGVGGHVVEALGEWEIGLPGPINRALHAAMRRYLSRGQRWVV
jgi:lipid II:glycine glycyltransferase (peptidoglycan interpeptide bridge formation enzyme)